MNWIAAGVIGLLWLATARILRRLKGHEDKMAILEARLKVQEELIDMLTDSATRAKDSVDRCLNLLEQRRGASFLG